MTPFIFLLSGLFCLASAFLIYGLIPILKRFVLDKPNLRSSHVYPTPRGGGVVFVFLSLLSSCILLYTEFSSNSVFPLLILVSLPLSIVGFLDDCFGISPSIRFCVQLGVSLFIIQLSPFELVWFVFPLLAIAVSAVINFVNFMDGLDGLVAGCMAIVIAALCIYLSAPWPLWALFGSLFGFLFWNWSPAKVFMGDVGSTYLGAIFSGLVLQAPNWPEALACLLVATPLLGDALFCVIRRLFKGQRIFQAHRLHLFQRLNQAGLPHAHVSSLYIAATAVLAFSLIFGGLLWVIPLAALELVLGIWLDQQVAVPFAVASRS
ncbi:glycosyl transferase 4 family protein [Synechococcus sp. A18-46.1]|nr:glycosyl transferase 4 family protein [Synechococcus sp. A18-46.1]